jgi:hypothetical protein
MTDLPGLSAPTQAAKFAESQKTAKIRTMFE